MKKRTAAAAILIVALGLITWEFYPGSHADKPSAPPVASTKVASGTTKTGTSENHPQEVDPESPEVNQRTRPSQPPVEKVYPKPKVPDAQPVPGKQGFVFSPFNNKIIDVTGIPPGTLIADPTYPSEEQKHFRVPK